MLIVQPRLWGRGVHILKTAKSTRLDISYSGNDGDEELGAVGVGSCISHAHHKWTVMFEHWVELILKLSPPDGLPTSASASGVSCLDHELLYYTMEDVTIEVTIICMYTEVLHSLWTAAQ